MAAQIATFARAGVVLWKNGYGCMQATARVWHKRLVSARHGVLFAVNPIRTFFPCFLFHSYPADLGMQRFSLQFTAFVFPTHPLHIPSRIDKEELPGVAV